MKITDELRHEVRRHITAYFEKIARSPNFRRRMRNEEKMAQRIGCSFKIFRGWYCETNDDWTAADERKIIRWALRQFHGLQETRPDLLPRRSPLRKRLAPVSHKGRFKTQRPAPLPEPEEAPMDPRLIASIRKWLLKQ